ncbi:PREDICTED: uncharacterized protein LOC107336572 [Acropora digitifera]|uniref:uncharacterized protein LOC107336572 n=1 Tax=Acropora digitifera TaxID=70779 RepID=UPI00077A144B|nr:PREDICTED: uncharacterized protein LOC107336572 [Acropora digitifera]XP_015757127.1 PREDICTED: uncharacterized protein LOC107336572 [Acropora digitifera]
MKISDTHQSAWIVFLFAGIWCVSFASECVPPYGYKGCACTYSPKEINNTEFVNLLPLKSNSSSPRFTTEDTIKWFYSYSPCGVFNKFINQNQTGYKACVKASVGRWTQESTHRCESLGDDSSAKFLSTKVGDDDGNIKSNLTLAFRNSISGHGAKISLICNETMAENEAIFEFINVTNTPTDTYYLALTSKCCCKGACGIPPVIILTRSTTGPTKGGSPKQAKEAWKIALIVIGGVLFVLIVALIVYCCKKSRSGYQMI